MMLWFLQFQTTSPKSCYMRPPGGILAPDQSLIATGNATIYLYTNFLCLTSDTYYF